MNNKINGNEALDLCIKKIWVDIFYKEKIGPTEKILIIIGPYKLLGPYLHFIFHINYNTPLYVIRRGWWSIRLGYYLIIIYSVHAISWVLFSNQGCERLFDYGHY